MRRPALAWTGWVAMRNNRGGCREAALMRRTDSRALSVANGAIMDVRLPATDFRPCGGIAQTCNRLLPGNIGAPRSPTGGMKAHPISP